MPHGRAVPDNAHTRNDGRQDTAGNRPGRKRAARNTPPVKGAGHCFPEHSRTIFMNSSPVIVSFSTR